MARASFLSIERQRLEIYAREPSAFIREAYAGIMRTLATMADAAAERGIRLVVVLAPDEVQVNGRVREALAQVTRRGDAPAFTSSFGIAHSSDAADFNDLVQRADAAVFAAKDAGRDGICLDGHSMPVAPTTLAALA